MTAPEKFVCEPWCIDGDGHPGYVFRADQSCWGLYRKTVFGLDEQAPSLPVMHPPADANGIAVYAYRGWYQLPKVKLNVFYDPGSGHGSPSEKAIDHDFLLTPAEAIELANNLIAAVEDIASARPGEAGK